MRKADVDKVKQEIKRLLAAIKDLEAEQPVRAISYYGGKASGAVKRASMDLTRALSDMRHPWRDRE